MKTSQLMSEPAGEPADRAQHRLAPQPRRSGLQRKSNVASLAQEIARRREQLRHAIAAAAYYRAQQRGFAPGHELDDWLAASEEVLGKRS